MDIFLPYGINKDKYSVHISEVHSGKTELMCPYCGGLLTAKKGLEKAHHFAHSGKTCREIANYYDFYDMFRESFPTNLGLYEYAMQRHEEIAAEHVRLQSELATLTSDMNLRNDYIAEAVKILENISQPYKDGSRPKNRQKNFEVLQQLLQFKEGILKTGLPCRTPFKQTFLPDFSQVRHGSFEEYVLPEQPKGKAGVSYPITTKRYFRSGEIWQFERDYHLIPKPLYWAFYRLPDYHKQRKALNQIRADITSFLEEQERFQQFTLYFLELRTDSHIYHKIGITGRTVKERVAEVEQDARKLGSVQIAVKHQVKGYAFLETFFKHKYADYQLEFGQYTEYFDLPADILKGIEEDLNRLEYLSLDRIGKIKAGMQKAKAKGKHVGRPAEQEKTQEFLQKPKSQEILTLLQQGFALREIERQTGYAINTIRKVKNAMQ